MILVFDQDIPIISFKNPKVAALEGYDTLIDITKEGYECRMTFSNGNYDFKTLVRRSTRDRGVIVTVE